MSTQWLVPIYLANIKFGKFKKQGSNEKLITKIELNRQVVKGFTPKDIIKRMKSSIIKKAGKCGKTEVIKVINVELLSQHGCGVND